MKNFVYHNPTKIIFGKNIIPKIGDETAVYGKKVFLVYGQNSIKSNGIYSKVVDSLQQAGCEITEFSGIKPNPGLHKVREGIQLFRQHQCDVICAVGGGSVIDTAKAISCGAMVDHDVWKFFTTKKSIKDSYPLTCISTIAGSGSETNHGMVITNEEKTQKFGFGNKHLCPRVALLDPETTQTVSKLYSSYGAADTIAHLTEFYLSNSVDSSATVNHRIIEGIITSVLQNCETIQSTPRDYEARSQLMWAASLALNGICSAGLGWIGFPVHLIEHSISALHNTTHGAGLAVILPGWMKHEAQHAPEKIASLGRSIFGLSGGSDESIAQETALSFKQWFASIGCPTTLDELGIEGIDIEKISMNSQELAKVWRLKRYDVQTVITVLQQCK